MKRNVGNLDRWLRVLVIAPVAVILAFVVGAGSILGIVLFAVAAIMLVTGLAGSCPLYSVFRINTCQRRGARA
jgi:Protein of unknown function (DUF2892)